MPTCKSLLVSRARGCRELIVVGVRRLVGAVHLNCLVIEVSDFYLASKPASINHLPSCQQCYSQIQRIRQN
jgi:hypothetical protein